MHYSTSCITQAGDAHLCLSCISGLFFATVSAGDTSFIYGDTTAIIKGRLLTNINVIVRIEIQEVKTFEGKLFSSSYLAIGSKT